MHNTKISKKVLGSTLLKISRLGLGTAEIGFNYGIGPVILPSEADAIRVLKTAVDEGVLFFDTANYYGLAEERIGKSGILKNQNVIVCTKCAQFLEKGEYFPASQLEKKIREEVEISLTKLSIDSLPLLLLHGPSAVRIREGVLIEIVEKLKKEGKVRYWGASTRGVDAPLALIESRKADVAQVAFNIADRRMETIFNRAEKYGFGIINRSVYLKGVFSGKAKYLSATLEPLKATVARAQKIAQDLGITLPELALRYTLSESAIDVTLVGSANVAHIKSAVEWIARGPLPPDVVEKLRSLSIADVNQVDPARWPK